MDFQMVVRILKRSWWIVVLAVSGVLVSAASFTSTQTPIYEASTTLVIGPPENFTSVHEIANSIDTLDRRNVIATYSKISSSKAVLEQVRGKLLLSPEQMNPYRIKSAVVPDTNILRITVEGPDPGLAAVIANALAEQVEQQIKKIYRLHEVQVLDPAARPARPSRPVLGRVLGVGAVLGFILGVGGAFLNEFLRKA